MTDHARGSDFNIIRWGETVELFGDKHRKPEKPTTVIKFPGGHVEVSRTSDNRYWAHLTLSDDGLCRGMRIDARPPANEGASRTNAGLAALEDALMQDGVWHVAVLIEDAS